MSNNRDPRSVNNRVNESRVTDARLPISFSDYSGFNVPREVLEKYPDIAFNYIAFRSGNEELLDNYDEAVEARGFTPSSASEFPELKRRNVASPFAKRKESDLIEFKGQVLMHRPKEFQKMEVARYEQKRIENEQLAERHRGEKAFPSVMHDSRNTWKHG